MHRGKAALIIATLVVAAFAVGCGDNDEPDAGAGPADAGEAPTEAGTGSTNADGNSPNGADGTPTRPIAKAAFVKRANAICKATVSKITSDAIPVLEDAGDSEKAREDAEKELAESVLLPGLQAEVDELRALGAPKGDERQVEAVLSSIEEIVDKGEADIDSFAQQSGWYDEATRLADKYRLIECPYG